MIVYVFISALMLFLLPKLVMLIPFNILMSIKCFGHKGHFSTHRYFWNYIFCVVVIFFGGLFSYLCLVDFGDSVMLLELAKWILPFFLILYIFFRTIVGSRLGVFHKIMVKNNTLYLIKPFKKKAITFQELQKGYSCMKPFFYRREIYFLTEFGYLCISPDKYVGGFDFVEMLFKELGWEQIDIHKKEMRYRIMPFSNRPLATIIEPEENKKCMNLIRSMKPIG